MNAQDLNEIMQTAQGAAAWRGRRQMEHVSIGRGLRMLVFLAMMIPLAIGTVLVGFSMGPAGAVAIPVGMTLAAIVSLWVSLIPRVASEWERAVVLRFGRFNRVKGPGIIPVFPVADTIRFIDLRVVTIDIPHQQVITRDNVPVSIDGVVFFQVRDSERAVLVVQDVRQAVIQYSQAALRDVIGSMTLDELLSERDEIQQRIGAVVEAKAKDWGVHIDSIRLLDVQMPEELKRMMSRQASAEREKRATITKAEGDREAAVNLAAAAETMASSPGAMQLRTLQTLDGLGNSASNTVLMAVPVEVLQLAQSLARTKLNS